MVARHIRQLQATAKIETVHTGGNVAWMGNGSTIFTTCSNVVKAVDISGCLSSETIGDPEEELRITSIGLSTDSTRLYVAYNNQTIKEVVIEEGEKTSYKTGKIWKSMHEAPILIMQHCSTTPYLATGSADNTVKVWDMAHQQCSHFFRGDSVVSAICFVGFEFLLVGYISGTVRFLPTFKNDRQSSEFIRTNPPCFSQITSILQIPNSKSALIVSRDNTASIFKTSSMKTFKTIPLFEAVESAAFAKNGNLITVGEEGTIKEWKIEGAKLIRSKKISEVGLSSITFNAAREEYLITSEDHNLFILNAATFGTEREIVGMHHEVYSCCFAGPSDSHLVVASNTPSLLLYDTATLDCKLAQGHSESILTVAKANFDPCLVASGSKDNTVIVWRLMERDKWCLEPIAKASGHTASVNSLRLSHSAANSHLLSLSSDCTIKLWSLKLLPTKEQIEKNKFKDLISLTASSTLVAHGKDANCLDLAISDKAAISGGMDKLVKLWRVDASSGHLLIGGTLSGHRRGIVDVAFSAHNQKAASASVDLTVKVWDTLEQTCLFTLTGHTCAVFQVLFVATGKQVMSADSSGILRLWSLENGECEMSLEAHEDKIWSVAPNSVRNEFATAGGDGKMVIWKDVTEEKIEEENRKRRKQVEQEQTLHNLLEQNRFQDALDYALELARPACAYKVIDKLIENAELQKALSKLERNKLQMLLDFATQWNTNSKSSQASQEVLFNILLFMPPDEILKLPNARSFVEAFIPYTKRQELK
ncbi:hypothetical protein WR25_00080 [Diploscapter pachys]|uniref:U3 small nucleolar RNA-associated protein 13 C-terminal domain-containing protein n=1 Tax=Diploscapter pachys TaxID=2018661 RepID=A0A2A2KEB4_9BILA|nr:hypothetical protein WR25_00080 [Diploscapter pachys]